MALKVCVYIRVYLLYMYYMYMYIFDYVDNCTGSSESADPNTIGGGVTSKSECFVVYCIGSQMSQH